MKKTFESLIEKGYEDTGVFGNYTILKKGDERILYNPIEDNIFGRWNINDLMKPTQEGDLESSVEDGFNVF